MKGIYSNSGYLGYLRDVKGVYHVKGIFGIVQGYLRDIGTNVGKLFKGKILLTRSHNNEMPLDRTTETPLEHSSGNPLGK